MEIDSRIFIAGHRGMVGSAIMRSLLSSGFKHIITAPREYLDLRDPHQVENFFSIERPEYIFLAAARVGGILANIHYPAEFLYDNLMIETSIIHQAYRFGVKKVLFLGSSCIYPAKCPQPMKEKYILTGPLEPTNEGYALAKIAGIRMLEYYHKEYGLDGVCPVPCNLYGPNDHFDPERSHVIPALIKKFVDAVDEDRTSVIVWGSGNARREFMHVDDLARACCHLMNCNNAPFIVNVGWGTDVTIRELAELISQRTGFYGDIIWDIGKEEGMVQKCLDIARIRSLGFQPEITLIEGIESVIQEYRNLKENEVNNSVGR